MCAKHRQSKLQSLLKKLQPRNKLLSLHRQSKLQSLLKKLQPRKLLSLPIRLLCHRETQSCDSGSDIELILVRPAKRVRSAIKVEPLLQGVLPVKQDSVKQQLVKQELVKQEVCKNFCPQGHELIWKALGTSTSSRKVGSKEASLVHSDRMTCDLCGVVEEGQNTWRCDLCNWDVCQSCASLGLSVSVLL